MNAQTAIARRAIITALITTAVAGAASSVPASAAVVYRIDSLADAVDARPGDGACRTAGRVCSLRAAMMEAESHPLQAPTVVLPAGRFELTRRPAILPIDITTSANGDLVALSSITIRGAGARQTIIDGNGLDRVFANVSPLAHMSISDLTVTGGFATQRELLVVTGGGGIVNQGRLTLTRVTVTANRADYGGGVFNTPSTTADIRESTISDNTANLEGGGIRFDATGNVINSTITGNRVLSSCCPPGSWDGSMVGEGGGIDARGAGQVTIVNSTIAANHAITGGGGVNIATGYQGGLGPVTGIGGPLVLRNTILAANTTDTGPANCKNTIADIISAGHNLDDDGGCGLTATGDIRATNPLLGPFGDHGGPTDTFSLLTASPAIDHANNCPPTDQRGTPRTSPCDIGAYEYNPQGGRASG